MQDIKLQTAYQNLELLLLCSLQKRVQSWAIPVDYDLKLKSYACANQIWKWSLAYQQHLV